MDPIRKTVINLILRGEFVQAKKHVLGLSKEDFDAALFMIGFDEFSVCTYSFVCFLIHQAETEELHLLAMSLIVNTLHHIDGMYETALYHIRRTIELSPDDIELEELLIFAHGWPVDQKLVSEEEVTRIAKKVLLQKPNSVGAQNVLKYAKMNN